MLAPTVSRPGYQSSVLSSDLRDFRNRRSRIVMSADASGTGRPARRIVALHGKGGDGESMLRGLKPLIDATAADGWEWVCPSAPHKIRGGTAWWLTAPGERSFEATTWEGMEESISMIEEMYPFDALLGYSQGAMLAAVLLARAQRGLGPARVPAIIGGAAWPKPYEGLLNGMPLDGLPRTIHTIGSQDDVNPPIMALQVADSFKSDAEVLNHPGGHWIPMDEESVSKMARFLNM